MPGRLAYIDTPLTDSNGTIKTLTSFVVCKFGTTTPITDTIYSDSAGTTPVAGNATKTLTSDANGRVLAYFKYPGALGTSIPGQVHLYSSGHVDMIVDVHVDPGDVVYARAGGGDISIGNAIVQTDVRAFKTSSNTWDSAISDAFASITQGGVRLPAELGQIDTAVQILVPAGKFLQSDGVYGDANAPFTSSGRGVIIRATAAITSVVRLNGQAAGIHGVAINANGNAIGVDTNGASSHEVWGNQVAIIGAINFGWDFGASARCSLAHFWMQMNGQTGTILRVGTDTDIGGPGRLKNGALGMEVAAGGVIAIGPFHITGSGGMTNAVKFSGSNARVVGLYTDTCEEEPVKWVGGGDGSQIAHIRHRNSRNADDATNLTFGLFGVDTSAGGTCQGAGATDWQFDKGSRTNGWGAVMQTFAGANNDGFFLGPGRCVDVPKLFMTAADLTKMAQIDPVVMAGGLVALDTGNLSTMADSATVTPDFGTGTVFGLTAAASPRTIAAPAAQRAGQTYRFLVKNATGGALVTTWNAVYKMAAWTDPANNKTRSIEFVSDGTNLWEVGRVTADL